MGGTPTLGGAESDSSHRHPPPPASCSTSLRGAGRSPAARKSRNGSNLYINYNYRRNCREESEKFNVWVAYLNLEAQYGGPSAAAQLFQRALPYCEPKKIYMAMLDIAETRGDKETAQASDAR